MGMMVFPGVVYGDSIERFYHDLLEGGEYLNNVDLARLMAEKAPDALYILERYGHLFTRDKEGKISDRVVYSTGGHSLPRTLSCPPGGGIAIGNSLRAGAARSSIRIFEEVFACSLLYDGKRVTGAVCYDLPRGEVILFRAAAVIIATGGAGWLYYPHTDCTAGTTGDGFALAWEVGAELIDMEQVQFIPFGLTHPLSMCGVFVGEPSLAAPAGVLRNSRGKIILEELGGMTRAQVTRAIAEELNRGGGTVYGGLLLDLRPNLALPEGRRLWEARRKRGQLEAIRLAYGEAAYRWEEPWDIAPTAHYFMGGIKVDISGKSSIPGLYAAGQALGGLHGANRLGSVSLAELFVFGFVAGETAARECKDYNLPDISAESEEAIYTISRLRGQRGSFLPLKLQRRLQKTMWENVGIVREEQGLGTALKEIREIEEASGDMMISPQLQYNKDLLHALELKQMLIVARLVTEAALLRQETRGAHFRLDFPQKDEENWRRNVVLYKKGNSLQVRTEGATK
jgi:succinate dehydrogenase/fumarate reductase flavoprotein subunit